LCTLKIFPKFPTFSHRLGQALAVGDIMRKYNELSENDIKMGYFRSFLYVFEIKQFNDFSQISHFSQLLTFIV
jgi:hypothetical protein